MGGWGVFNMPPGSFSDDGSMALCLAESFAKAGLNPEDAAQRFQSWYNEGYWTPKGIAYDIGGCTAQAMERLNKGVAALEAGPKGVTDNGNGSLMRILPAALYLAGETPVELARGIWICLESLTDTHVPARPVTFTQISNFGLINNI